MVRKAFVVPISVFLLCFFLPLTPAVLPLKECNTTGDRTTSVVFDNFNEDTQLTLASGIEPAEQEYWWNRTFGGTADNWLYCTDMGASVIQCDAGGYLAVGSTSSFGEGAYDVYLVRADEYGNRIWNRTYGTAGVNQGYGLVECTEGGFAIAGYTYLPGANREGWLIRVDEEGYEIWNKTYDRSLMDMFTSIVECEDGGFAMTGHIHVDGKNEGWILRTNSTGHQLWDTTFGGSLSDEAKSIKKCSGGGFAVAGYTYSFGPGPVAVMLHRFDANGRLLWNRTYGGANVDYAYAFVECSNGGFAIAGISQSFGGADEDMWLVRTDVAGNHVWNTTFGTGNTNHVYSIRECMNGGFILTGDTFISPGNHDLWLVRTDKHGNVLWDESYGGPEMDQGSDVIEVDYEQFIIVGRTNLSWNHYEDLWLVSVPPKTHLDHSVIAISSDSEFATIASTKGWQGSGGLGDPYLIEDLDINATGISSPCINISNTRVHFSIQNCLLHHSSSNPGIRLNNVTNGIIVNNTCNENLVGILLYKVANTMLDNNSFLSNTEVGIRIWSSSFNNVTNNICRYNWDGIEIALSSSNNILSNNTCSENTYIGLDIDSTSGDNTVTWNVFDNSLHNTDDDAAGKANVFVSNYYSDYAGSDPDEDGFGNNAYTIDGDAGTSDASPLMYKPYAPVWVIPPRFMMIEVGNDFYLDLDAVAQSPISWSLDDPVNFDVDDSGVVTNAVSLSVNVYEVQVTVSNIYGLSISDLMVVTVESNNPPYLTDLVTDLTVELGVPVHYDINATDPSGIDMWWLNDTLAENFTIDGNGIVTNTSWLPLGSYGIAVWVNDTYGATMNINFTVTVPDRWPPIWIDTPSDQTSEFGVAFVYDIDATDPSGLDHWWLNQTLDFEIDQAGTITNSTPLSVGSYELHVWVNDTLGELIGAIFNVTVQDTYSPSWLETPTTQVLEFGNQFSYDLNAYDLSGLSHWTLNDTTSFAIDANGVITNDTILQVQDYVLQVSVNDTYDNTLTRVITIQVEDTTAPIWVTAPIDAIIECGDILDVQLEAWDLSDISHWATNVTESFGVSSLGRVFSFGVVLPGVYNIEIMAYDLYDNALISTMEVTVVDTTSPEWVISPVDHTIELGESFETTLDATDLTGIDTWWLNESDYVFTIDQDGVIRDNPYADSGGYLDVGAYRIGVCANDPHGNILYGVFTVTIEDTTPPIWITPPGNYTFYSNESVTLQLEAYDFAQLGEWTVNDSRFVISQGSLYPEGMLSYGTYNIEITVTDYNGNTLSGVFKITWVEDEMLQTLLLISFVTTGGIVVVVLVVLFHPRGLNLIKKLRGGLSDA